MRFPLLVIALCVATSTNAAPKATASGAPPSAASCPDLNYIARQKARPKARTHKLNELPPADAVYAMLPMRNGCPDLTPVKIRR